MLRKNLFYIAAAILTLFACQKEKAIEEAGSSAPKNINITVAGLSQATKAAPTSPVDTFANNHPGDVSVLDVYVTNASDIILRALRITRGSTEWTKVTGTGYKFINVQSSASRVYVAGNLGGTLGAEGTNVNSVDLTKTLGQMTNTTLLYLGSDSDLSPSVSEPVSPDQSVGTTYNAQVSITPIVSRFQITKIAFQSSGSETVSKVIGGETKTATVAWTGFSGDLKGVYLNRFYSRNIGRTPYDLRHNLYAATSISAGHWFFGGLTGTDFATEASYSNYAEGNYETLSLPQTASKCYAFYFFPENLETGNTPKLHFQLSNLVKTTLTSTDQNVFNPSLFPLSTDTRYVNVLSFVTPGLVPLTAADFQANKLYNVELTIKPYFLQDDITKVQYNVLCTVTILPWTVSNIIPIVEE